MGGHSVSALQRRATVENLLLTIQASSCLGRDRAVKLCTREKTRKEVNTHATAMEPTATRTRFPMDPIPRTTTPEKDMPSTRTKEDPTRPVASPTRPTTIITRALPTTSEDARMLVWRN